MSTQPLGTFSLANTTMSFLGVEFGGYGPDRAWSIEPVGELYTVEEGVDGSVVRVATGSKLWIARVSLQFTSSVNAKMSAIYNFAENFPGGISGPLLYKDALGLDAFFSPAAFISKLPTFERGNKPTVQEWQIHAADGKAFFGGANAPLLALPPIPGLT